MNLSYNDSFAFSHLMKKSYLRAFALDMLDFRAVDRYRTTMGWSNCKQYADYWEKCRAEYQGDLNIAPEISEKVADFKRKGFTSLQTSETTELANRIYAKIKEKGDVWKAEDGGSACNLYVDNFWSSFPEIEELFTGLMSDFLKQYFGCDFKIWQAVLYRSFNLGDRHGSQGWHSDSGPGSCVNMLFYLHEMDEDSGGIELLNWNDSVTVYKRARKKLRNVVGNLGRRPEGQNGRKFVSQTVRSLVETEYTDRVESPISEKPGLVVPFLNNLQHAGGFPASGKERVAIVFQFYPADKPIDWKRYAEEGVGAGTGYPQKPDIDF